MSEDQHVCLTSPGTAWTEIERLRAENAALQKAGGRLLTDARAEIERLRAENLKLRQMLAGVAALRTPPALPEPPHDA